MARIPPPPQRVRERIFLEKDAYFSCASHESLGNHFCMVINILLNIIIIADNSKLAKALTPTVLLHPYLNIGCDFMFMITSLDHIVSGLNLFLHNT
jgi:hypothetical protein